MKYQVKFGFIGKLMDSLMMREKFNSVLETMFQSMVKFIHGATLKRCVNSTGGDYPSG